MGAKSFFGIDMTKTVTRTPMGNTTNGVIRLEIASMMIKEILFLTKNLTKFLINLEKSLEGTDMIKMETKIKMASTTKTERKYLSNYMIKTVIRLAQILMRKIAKKIRV